jgi:excisionase family DNA binding protein
VTSPEQLVVVVPGDVALVLLVKAGLREYRIARRGENRRVDDVLVEMTAAAIRWRESTGNGHHVAPTQDTGTPSQWLTTTQAAQRARVSDRTIRRAITDGRLPATRHGHAYAINRDDIDRYTRSVG